MHATRVSLSEVLAALSYALDLTEGQPPGHTIRSCLIGMRLAADLLLDSEARSALYYALLLKDAGCSSNAARTASLFGSDDHAVKRALKTVDWSQTLQSAAYAARNAGRGRNLLVRVAYFWKIALASASDENTKLFEMRCERGAEIARHLRFPEATAQAIRNLDEHWDGKGKPDGKKGDTIPLLGRIAGLSQTVDVFLSNYGPDTACEMVRERRGRWFDPRLADLVLKWRGDTGWWDHLLSGDLTDAIAAAEPADRIYTVDERGLEEVAQAFAEIIDAKSPYTYRHSSGVAEYARGIAREMRLSVAEQQALFRAGLLHDIGKLGVSNRILDKQGALTEEERQEVERHPEYTWEILRRVGAFQDVAWTAARHHERLDGSGYPWRLNADWLDMPARILAVADVYEALTANRPYRGGLTPATAIAIMREEQVIHLDMDALDALEQHVYGDRAETLATPRREAAVR